jgi:hypothetical protein
MGGERGSSARMRLAGKTCCFCRSMLSPPYPGRERACSRCQASRTIHRLSMRFEKCFGWRVSFQDLENNGVTLREFTFADSAKIEELVARTSTPMRLEDRQALEHGLRRGLGAVNLVLADEQYRKLLR